MGRVMPRLPPLVLADMDGCFADFNGAWLRLLNGMTGRDRQFGPDGPQVWDWLEQELGFTPEEVDRAWRLVEQESGYFWEHDVCAADGAREALEHLHLLDWTGQAEVYFVTARRGPCVRKRTQRWLKTNGFPGASVILARNKGTLVRALAGGQPRHVIAIDDRPQHIQEYQQADVPRVYVVDHGYNREVAKNDRVIRVATVWEAVKREFTGVEEAQAA